MSQEDKMSGFLSLQNANVKWFLSLDKNDLPEECTFNNINNLSVNYKLMVKSLNLQMVLRNCIQKYMRKY